MSIHVHKTGLNKTLGQQSDAVISTNLIGDFNIKFGQASSYWSNQVSGSTALRRYNGISLVLSSHPYYYQFDGTDDYLGEASSGYGGSAFNVAFFKMLILLVNGYIYPILGPLEINIFSSIFYHDSSNYVMFQIDGSVVEIHSYTSSGNLANLSMVVSFNPRSHRDKWVYYTITHNGSGTYKAFANGTFLGKQSTSAPSATAKALTIGKYGSSYTTAGVRVGHIHVYSSELTNSQVRQNYLASHDMNNVRYFGDTALELMKNI